MICHVIAAPILVIGWLAQSDLFADIDFPDGPRSSAEGWSEYTGLASDERSSLVFIRLLFVGIGPKQLARRVESHTESGSVGQLDAPVLRHGLIEEKR